MLYRFELCSEVRQITVARELHRRRSLRHIMGHGFMHAMPSFERAATGSHQTAQHRAGQLLCLQLVQRQRMAASDLVAARWSSCRMPSCDASTRPMCWHALESAVWQLPNELIRHQLAGEQRLASSTLRGRMPRRRCLGLRDPQSMPGRRHSDSDGVHRRKGESQPSLYFDARIAAPLADPHRGNHPCQRAQGSQHHLRARTRDKAGCAARASCASGSP